MLTEEDDQLVEFGIGGICNLCLGELMVTAEVMLHNPIIFTFIAIHFADAFISKYIVHL